MRTQESWHCHCIARWPQAVSKSSHFLRTVQLWMETCKNTDEGHCNISFTICSASTRLSVPLPSLPSSNAAAATILLTWTWLMCRLGASVTSVFAWVGRKYDVPESQCWVSHRRTPPEVYLHKEVDMMTKSYHMCLIHIHKLRCIRTFLGYLLKQLLRRCVNESMFIPSTSTQCTQWLNQCIAKKKWDLCKCTCYLLSKKGCL